MRFCYLLLLFVNCFISINSYSQVDSTHKEKYSTNSSYNDIYRAIQRNYSSDTVYAKKLLKTYLKKSKKDSFLHGMAISYNFLKNLYRDNTREKYFAYADSAIKTSKDLKDSILPATIYIGRGAFLESEGKLLKAIDDYTLAVKYSVQNPNPKLMNYAIHNIGVLKKRVKKYEDAKRLFKKALDYETSKSTMNKYDSLSYLITINEMIDTYRLNGQLDSAKVLNEKSFRDFRYFIQKKMFILNKGIILCQEGKNDEALSVLTSVLPFFEFKNIRYGFDSDYYAVNTYYYHGLANKNLGNSNEAIKSWLKVDSIIEKKKFISYLGKETYSQLISIYKLEKNEKLVLGYINKYLKTDSLISKNLHTLDEKIIEDYDRPLILKQKREIQESLDSEIKGKSVLYLISIFIIILSILIILYYFIRQKRFKKRLDELLSEIEDKKESAINHENISSVVKPQKLKISDVIVKDILIALSEFESEKGFLDSNITIGVLAKKINTNTRYLSSVINKYKEKKYVEYINNLRIDYFINKAKSDNQFHKYTIKAIARECGFKTSEVFSKSFYKKTGIYPSYFLKKISI